MSYFSQVHHLSCYDLYAELVDLLDAGMISWRGNQICINTLPSHPDSVHTGCGSLWYDWDNSHTEIVNGISQVVVPERATKLKESDFSVLATPFKGSLFEDIYDEVKAGYIIGRMRVMKSEPRTCMTWHIDDTRRLHYPMKTQDGCFMVIGSEVAHLPERSWWMTDTLNPHTAFNGSSDSRIHLVVEIL